MSDENWKKWVIVAIVSLGLGVEILKHMPSDQSLQDDSIHLAADDTPYAVSDDEMPTHPRLATPIPARPVGQPVLQKAAVAFAAENKVNTTDSNKPKDLKKPMRELQPGEKYVEVIDPKTGKKTLKIVRKRKKAEPKKDDVASNPVTPSPDLSALLNPNADLGAAVAAAAGAGAGADLPTPTNTQTATNTNNNSPTSLADWERLLLQSPNRAETLIFIKDFKAGSVSSNIYYTIVRAMIADSRADMKQLGLLCAGSATSATSFTILADIDKSDTTGTLKSTADTYISQYATSAQLGTLKTVLTGSDTHAAYMAALQVDTVFKASGATNLAQYQVFLPLLKNLQTSSDSQLSQEAQSLYQEMETQLASAGINTSVQAATAIQP